MLGSFIKTYAHASIGTSYCHTALVSHGGVLIGFSLDSDQQFWYTVLDLENDKIDSPIDVNYWLKEPVPLLFPKEITQVGYSIAGNQTIPDPTAQQLADGTIEVKPDKEKTLRERFLASTARLTADTPFHVMSDGQYIYLFRQAIAADHAYIVKAGDVPIVNSTLLVDRFVFTGNELKPKLEVRYQRSRSKDRPLNRKDSLDSQDLERKPFYEPTQELDMVRHLTDGRFTVILLPTAIPNIKRWQIFAHNSRTGLIDSFNIERSKNGLFNPRGTQFYTCDTHPDVFEMMPGTCPDCASDLIPRAMKEGFAESALAFNGTNTWVKTGLKDLSGSALTIEFWFKGDNLNSVVRQQSGSRLIGLVDGCWVLPNDGGTENGLAIGALATDGKWHHLAMTWQQGTKNGFVSYLDGRVVARRDSADIPLPKLNAAVTLGGDKGKPFAHGTLDEVRVWNRARSQNEMKTDLHRRLIGYEDGLVAYWRFDEGSGKTIHDQTDNAYHGTIQGKGTWVNSDAPVGDNPGVSRSSFAVAGRTIAGGLSALLYHQQEKRVSGYSQEPKPIKKNTRLMLALVTQQSQHEKKCIAILDFALSREGKLTLVPDSLNLPVLGKGEASCSINEALDRKSSLEVEIARLNYRIGDLKHRITSLIAASKDWDGTIKERDDTIKIKQDFIAREQAYRNEKNECERILEGYRKSKATITFYGFSNNSTPFHLDIGKDQENPAQYQIIRTIKPCERFGFSFHGLHPVNGDDGLVVSIDVKDDDKSGFRPIFRQYASGSIQQWLGYAQHHLNLGCEWRITLNLSSNAAATFSAYQRRLKEAESNLSKLPQVRDELSTLQQEKADIELIRDTFPTTLKNYQDELAARELELVQKEAERAELTNAQLGEVRVPMELLHTDRFGLTLSGGVLSFAYTNDTPTLFDSATGKLGLYFRGATDDQFFAAYFDTLTERVVHTLPASTGQIILEARNTDGEMDATTITVAEGNQPETCTLTFHNTITQITETWVDLPRQVHAFAQILNGNGLPPLPAPSETTAPIPAASEAAPPPSLDEAQRQQMLDELAQNYSDHGDIQTQVIVLKAMQPGDPRYQAAMAQLTQTLQELMPTGMSESVVTSEDDSPSLAQPAYYDYSQVQISQTDKSIEKGSLFFNVKLGDAQGEIQNTDEPIQLGQVNTRVNEWVADSQGNALYLDGETTLAVRDENVPLEQFDIASDVTLETWVKADSARSDQQISLINHVSQKSKYYLGLQGATPGKSLVFNGQNTYIETSLKDLSGSDLTIEYWFKGKHLTSAVTQKTGAQALISGWSKPNGSISFNGKNQYVEVPFNPALNPAQFTISLWVKVTGGQGAYRSPMTSRSASGGRYGGYLIYADPNNQWSLIVGNGGGWSYATGSTVTLNTWTHICGTYDGKVLKLYVNGKLEGTTSLTNPLGNQGAPLRFGAGNTETPSPQYYFPGLISEVSIWDKAFSPEEIQANMQQSLTGQEAGLVAYYPLNEICQDGADGQVMDTGKHSCHGKILSGSSAPSVKPDLPPRSGQGRPLESVSHRFITAGQSPIDLPIQGNITDGRWHHVAMIWRQGQDKGFISYLDGEVVGQQPTPDIPLPKLDAKVMIGATLGQTDFLEGSLAEVRIWNVARSQSQIRLAMRKPIRSAMPGLVACWSLMDGDLKDYSGNDYDGILHGKTETVQSYPLEAAYAVAAVGNQIIKTEQFTYLDGWVHLASAFNQSYALQFDGIDDYLNAGQAGDLNITQDLTIEAFIKTELGQGGGLITKGRLDDGDHQDVPYSLSIGGDGRLIFAFERTDHEKEICQSSLSIPSGQFCKVAVVRTLGMDQEAKKVKEVIADKEWEMVQSVTTKEWLLVSFFINGQPAGYKRYEAIKPGTSDQPLEIGKAYRSGGSPIFFKGIISEVRLWSRALPQSELGSAIKGQEKGLSAWWRFEENAGNTAFDSKGSNHGDRLGARWVKNPDPQGSSFIVYINGVSQKAQPLDFIAQGDQGFTLGGYYNQGQLQGLLKGSLEETRIWRITRTQEQIQDNMFRRVLGERKELQAYYQFDADVDNRLSDCSGRAHHLTVLNPDWQISNAPVSYETPQVRSALAGVTTAFHDQIQSRPAIQEYGDMQYNDDNELIGVMKRCYAYIKNGEWQLITGFKIGNIVTEWVGQAQYDPQIIGFIEGAPPVPSENCTEIADSEYSGGSSVEIVEADNVQYSLGASHESTLDASFRLAASMGGGNSTLVVSAPLGVGTASEMVEINMEAALEGNIELSNAWSSDSSVSSGKNVSKQTRVTATGNWESDTNILNPAIGKRFVFNNVGFALVQSDTADIYALRMEHNQALIAFRFQPNPDIPKDWNLVPFQMNPRYVRQGTLDGRVGMTERGNVYDPSYPNARDYGEYSYFKPREAYLLKNQIRQAEEDLKTYYNNFSTSPMDADRAGKGAGIGAATGAAIGAVAGPLGMAIGAAGGAVAGSLIGGLTGDQRLPQKLAKRNLVNTYVWTADGGFFAETTELTEAMSETVGGSFSLGGAVTLTLGLQADIGPVSTGFEMEASIGGSLNLTKTKTRESERSFGVSVEVEVPNNLQKYADGNPVYDPEGNPVLQPGKVDAYRFMTFYLEPSVQNFDMFINKVVDPIWLQESRHPNAAALRSALKSQQKANKDTQKSTPWRVMHRVTFVSRVLPEIDPGQAPLTPEQTLKAAEIDSNYELIKRLEPFVSDKVNNYVQFTDAVRQAIDAYIPELKPAKDYIIEYMCQYYQVFDGLG